MTGRSIKLLELAAHPQTTEAEAMSALRMFRSAVEREGGITSFLARVPSSQPKTHSAASLGYGEKLQLIMKLERDIEELNREIVGKNLDIEKRDQEIAKLNTQIEALRATANNRVKAYDDGTMDFADFIRQAINRIGTPRAWRKSFEEQTGLSFKPLEQKFRRTGVVPADYVESLKKLTPVFNPRNYDLWSLSQVNELRKLHDEGVPDIFAAERLTKSFGFPVTERNVRFIKKQSRQRVGLFVGERFGAPMENIDPDGSRKTLKLREKKPDQDRAVARAPFPWEKYPQVELEAARKFISGTSIADIAKYVCDETNEDVGANQINNKMYNNPPPAGLNAHALNITAPTSWLELWFLYAPTKAERNEQGTRKGWLNTARTELGIPRTCLMRHDPNPYIDKDNLRQMRYRAYRRQS